jgi:hypothetical protein
MQVINQHKGFVKIGQSSAADSILLAYKPKKVCAFVLTIET